MTTSKLRLTGHGQRLRVRAHGDWSDPLAGLAECCRASIALDKTLAESIRQAREDGCSWPEIGQILGAAENAQSWPEIRKAMTRNRRVLWDRAFGSDN